MRQKAKLSIAEAKAMIYINNDSNDPYYNLALEEYFFKKDLSDEPVLLLWQNRPSVIIGRYQNTIEEINEDFVKANNIDVVRRITGGGAVFHDLGNLNYSFIVPAENTMIDFKTFTKPVIHALKKMGIDAIMTGRNDLEVDGKKFSGNAQYLYKNRLLHHGTLLFNSDLTTLDMALRMKKGKIESKSIKSVRSRVTNLKSYFEENIGVYKFKDMLLESFKDLYYIEEYKLTNEDSNSIETMKKCKYKTWEWTYGESPKCNVVRSSRFSSGYMEFHFQVEKGKIKQAYLYGDFFSNGNIEELMNNFIDIDYRRDALINMLENINLETYLTGVTSKEIVNTIC